MIIVITPEKAVDHETGIINELFLEGLDFLHVRKPWMNRDEIANFIKEIDLEFHHRLVLHNHHDLAENFYVSRFHFKETARQNKEYQSFTGKVISTSVHDIHAFNELSMEWEYAFISPAFPSVSKEGYGQNCTVLSEMKSRNNSKVKMIALGGINENTIAKAFTNGADGAALLGAVWESNKPVESFRKCRQKMMLYS
ncbi:thiamine phosphate synthase [Chryseobacterium sp. SSA4.19]|uniref:thiamine phosphate synthase n=1 Tax=Chryseobacterium sp. SSA4.19 TaxID=2919915 RepID=UPI001F4E58B4|nr:thiamine phosphate synthase [Chryseobacterium sp. SSA4.19]MCJ8154503.1 thiamine phosphate synthase [Chryseobacterium sp. SSA4.19]